MLRGRLPYCELTQ